MNKEFHIFIFLKSLTAIVYIEIKFGNLKTAKYFEFNKKCLEATYTTEKRKKKKIDLKNACEICCICRI